MQISDSGNPQQLTNDTIIAEHQHSSQRQQFQPGTYPQLKRSSLSNIPIYENIDGYPDLVTHQMITLQQQQQQQQQQQDVNCNPPPPPYTGTHTIVSADALTKRNSRYLKLEMLELM